LHQSVNAWLVSSGAVVATDGTRTHGYLDARFNPSYAHVSCVGGGGVEVPKLNENICAQIERAAQLLRAAAANGTPSREGGQGGVPKRPDLQEFVDTAASLEALVKRLRQQ